MISIGLNQLKINCGLNLIDLKLNLYYETKSKTKQNFQKPTCTNTIKQTKLGKSKLHDTRYLIGFISDWLNKTKKKIFIRCTMINYSE